MFSLRKFIRSLKYAWRGLVRVYRSEQNFRIISWAALIVVIAAAWLGITSKEWVIVVLVITFVLVLELMNTVAEKVVDILKPKIHSYVEIIKDVMAAAVLTASCAAVVIGLIIFLPYVKDLF